MIRPCFITAGVGNFNSKYRHESLLNALPQLDTSSTISTLPSTLTSVKVFDGSQIANEVVLSNNYWSTLVSKLPYIIAAEFLAAVIFIAIVSIVTSQGK